MKSLSEEVFIYFRELLAGYCLDAFLFIAPKRMRLIYAKHILLAAMEDLKEYRGELK